MKKDIEKALKEFLMDIRITGKERKKGIPLISFVYKEGDKAVFLRALPLPIADIQPEKQMLAGKELLYRADYYREGESEFSIGILPRISKKATFLNLLEDAIKSGNHRAGDKELVDYLKLHLVLCSLESIARDELSLAKMMQSNPADAAYYREVLSYVRTGRDILNARTPEIHLPPFPDRGAFMAKWYRENGQGSL